MAEEQELTSQDETGNYDPAMAHFVGEINGIMTCDMQSLMQHSANMICQGAGPSEVVRVLIETYGISFLLAKYFFDEVANAYSDHILNQQRIADRIQERIRQKKQRKKAT